MSIGVRVRRTATRTLSKLGTDSRITQQVIRRTCRSRGVECVFDGDTITLTNDTTDILLPLSHAMFAAYIAGDFDTFASSVAGRDDDGRHIVDFSHPQVHRYLELNADFDMPAFPEAIAFDSEYFLHGKPEPGATVFDLGANIGLVTYALSRAVGSSGEGRVVAFEPDPTSLVYFRKNIARHGLDNVTVVEQAIAPVAGMLEFYAEGTITSGLAESRKNAVMTQSAGDVIRISATTLAAAFAEHGTPSWIKMDIEGSEIDVLEQSLDVLAQAKPFLVIDTTHVVGNDTTAARVEAVLQSIGYTTETRFPGGSQLTWAAYGGFAQ